MELMRFDEVISYLDSKKRNRHLLIGNGFSIAYDSSIFSYNSLTNFVENLNDPTLARIFKATKTRNFEQTMKELDIASDIVGALGDSNEIVSGIREIKEKLKIALIDAVKTLHPEHVYKIPDKQSRSCADFLNTFLSKGGKVFSTNYDVLLYWVLMRNEIENAVDGFGRDPIETGEFVPEDEMEFSELRWGKHKDKQTVFYMHGSLPLFDDGVEIVKVEFDGDFIIKNIEDRMEQGQYPLFVTAGNGKEKLGQILHNYYLANCYDGLSSIDGSLITYGFNFGEYDDHIIRAINLATKQSPDSKLWSVYIGVYSEEDQKHIEAIKGKFKCKVKLFDSKSVKIWK